MSEEEVAEILLDIKAVSLKPKEPFRYASGILSPIYCDNRLLMGYPDKRSRIRDLFIEKVKDLKFEVIAGTATAGIPHAAWIADKLGLPMIYIRGKSKEHGKQNQIEGPLEKGKKVLVIEDGPTVTHGSMPYGAGTVAAEEHQAREIIDPRPFAVGSIVDTFNKYTHLSKVLPAMGYGKKQIKELMAML